MRRRRSAKRKPEASLERSRPAGGKTPRLGASFAKVRVTGQALPPLAEVPRVTGPRRCSSPAAVTRGSSGRAAEPPLEVMPISVWNPPAESSEFPHSMPEDMGRDHFGAKGGEDSLLSNAELAAGAVSSILKDSDLKKMDALPVEEALTLSLQGVIFVSPSTFVCSSHHCFMLHTNSTLFLGRWPPN